ncbi:MAG: aspartyl protease family protein [Gemmataceae bacterium]
MLGPLHQPPLLCSPSRHFLNPRDAYAPVGMTFRVRLWVETDDTDSTIPIRFLVDSGASYSSIDLADAEFRGLRVPPPEADQDLHLNTAAGVLPVTVRQGVIRCWWTPDLTGHAIEFPILFRVNPPSGQPLLGLGGVLRLCRWHFDPPAQPHFPYGRLALEDAR